MTGVAALRRPGRERAFPLADPGDPLCLAAMVQYGVAHPEVLHRHFARWGGNPCIGKIAGHKIVAKHVHYLDVGRSDRGCGSGAPVAKGVAGNRGCPVPNVRPGRNVVGCLKQVGYRGAVVGKVRIGVWIIAGNEGFVAGRDRGSRRGDGAAVVRRVAEHIQQIVSDDRSRSAVDGGATGGGPAEHLGYFVLEDADGIFGVGGDVALRPGECGLAIESHPAVRESAGSDEAQGLFVGRADVEEYPVGGVGDGEGRDSGRLNGRCCVGPAHRAVEFAVGAGIEEGDVLADRAGIDRDAAELAPAEGDVDSDVVAYEVLKVFDGCHDRAGVLRVERWVGRAQVGDRRIVRVVDDEGHASATWLGAAGCSDDPRLPVRRRSGRSCDDDIKCHGLVSHYVT